MSSNSINSTTMTQPSLKPGDKFDKFEIVEQIGAGGMSVVWKAFDRLLNRHVAVKQLLPGTGDREGLRDRFRQEAIIQKKITFNQKLLVNIIDFIDEPRGLFIVMEYVDGTTLEQLLAQNRGPMEERQALGIVGSIAMALDAMHSQGVIHRDLKPTNVLLPKAGGLKICDFGLSALIADQDSLTQGSVRYMAPELFHEDKVEPRADIYSLGMVAYEMLAGRDKFEDAFKFVLRDQRNQSLRWMKWHTNPRAKAPSLSSLNPATPPAIDELVMRMMEKDQPGRVGSAKDVVEAIRRHFTGGQPTVSAEATANVAGSAPTVSATEKTAALPKRKKLPMILAAIILAEAFAMGGYWMYRQQKQIDDANAARHAKAEELFNSANTDFNQEHFGTVISKTETLAKEYPNDPLVPRAQALAVLAQARWDLASQKYAEAIEGFKKADTLPSLKDRRDKISDYRRQAEASLAFVNLERNIVDAITSNKLGDARILIDQVRKLSLLPDEKERIRLLGEQIEARDRGAIFTSLLKEVDDLIQAQRWPDALGKLTKMAQRFPSDLDVKQRTQKVQQEIDYKALLDAAKYAETNGKTIEMIDAYTRVVQMRPSAEFSSKITKWRGDLAYDEGMKKLAAGNVGEARQSFMSAVGLSSHTGAKEQLKKLDAELKEADFIRAADDAFRKENYTAAIISYQEALKFHPNKELEAKIAEAKLQIKIRDARAAYDSGRLDVAKSAFAEILQISPENKEAKDRLDLIDRRDRYTKLLAAGDAARKEGKFADAAREYRRAQKVADEPEVRTRLDDNEYEQCLAQGRDYIRADRWKDAKAILLTAKRIRDTEEVQQLLSKVNEAEPPEKPHNE